MALEKLQPACGATHKTKRVGRGAGSGYGKTSSRGQKGQKVEPVILKKEVLKVVNSRFKEDFQKSGLKAEL